MISFQAIRPLSDCGKTKAFFTICFQTRVGGWINIKDCRLVDGVNGLFISYPSKKGNDGVYYDSLWLSDELRKKVNKFFTDKVANHIGGGGQTPWGVDPQGKEILEKPDWAKKKEPKLEKKEPEPVYDDELPF